MEESVSWLGGAIRLRCEHATTRTILGGRLRTALAGGVAPLPLRLVSPLDCGVRVVAMDALLIYDPDASRVNPRIRS